MTLVLSPDASQGHIQLPPPRNAPAAQELNVKHEPLTLIPPQFEAPLPPLAPAVFPPTLREPHPPALDQVSCCCCTGFKACSVKAFAVAPLPFTPSGCNLPLQFDLDEQFASQRVQLAQLTNKCQGDDDVEFYVREAGEILGVTAELPDEK